MIEAAQTAIAFVEGRRRSGLDQDRMLLFALVRANEIIGDRDILWKPTHFPHAK